jgi:pimeloyl-ACP methyl ester carboxylesterase
MRQLAMTSDDRHRHWQEARAAATVQLYRTFLLREVPTLNRYLDQRLVVPTWLLIGDGDPIGSPATLDGWQNHAEDLTIDGISGAGHFLPEEAPDEVAATARALFKR